MCSGRMSNFNIEYWSRAVRRKNFLIIAKYEKILTGIVKN